jgi:long-chain acyl-CoA synthetase
MRPRRVALRQKEHGIWKPLTWADYHRRATRVGLGFRAAGLSEGGHVGVLAENRVEWVLSQLGAGLVGSVTVGVYPTSPTVEVAYVLEHGDCQIVVCEDQEQSDKVLEARDRLPKLRRIVVMEKKGLADTRARAPELVIGFDELEALGAAAEGEGRGGDRGRAAAPDPRRHRAHHLHSGSTGKPKGAMISYGNVAAMAAGVVDRLGLVRSTSHLSYLPLCHVAEQMLTVFVPLYLGSRVDFGESIRTVQEDLREVAPSMFSRRAADLGKAARGDLDPHPGKRPRAACALRLGHEGVHAVRLQDARRAQPARAAGLRRRLPAGVPRPAELHRAAPLQGRADRRRADLRGGGAVLPHARRPLLEVYGMTETSGMVLGQRPVRLVPATVGVPTLGVEHRLSAQGELQVRGPVVFQGYYKNPEATAAALVDGWLHTGDVVEEKDGELRIVDRLKDIMITAGGKNLTPSEVENTMKASPFIKECVIVADARRFVAALVQIDFENRRPVGPDPRPGLHPLPLARGTSRAARPGAGGDRCRQQPLAPWRRCGASTSSPRSWTTTTARSRRR